MTGGGSSFRDAEENVTGQSNVPADTRTKGPSQETTRYSSTSDDSPTAGEARRVTFEVPSSDAPTIGHTPHAQERSYLPSLSIDTRNHSREAASASVRGQRSPLSPYSTQSSDTAPHTSNVIQNPQSPRTRDRGFSLRRSLLARNTYSGSSEDHGKSTELVTLGSLPAKSRPGADCAGRSASLANHSFAAQTSNNPTDLSNGTEPISSTTKNNIGSFVLSHYEDWANRKSAVRKAFVRLRAIKEHVRKTILRIHELPRSKDGRHICLDVSRRKPLSDERRGREYIDNAICSTRHSLYNFLPRQLFAQFSKLANFYFLCVSILQMIPGLSTTGQFTTIVPLLFFVGISIAKEGYDDLRRHRLDKSENKRKAAVLCAYDPVSIVSSSSTSSGSVMAGIPQRWAQSKWESVRVGDIVKVGRDEAFPADLVILHVRGTEGVAYVETMALDGETNLKTKQPCSSLAKACQTLEDMASCRAEIVAEDPNLDLYNFEGKVTVNDEVLPLANSEIVYRGSILRNTSEAFGIVIYTGEECKIRMNATKNPRIKAPTLQFAVNRVVIIIVIFVIALAIFNTIAYQIWRDNTEDEAWYLTNAGVAFFPILASFIILFNTLIPLSLYVSLEIVKLCQMFFLNDIHMFDEESNTPLEARTSTINEELGQVNYIFSDKTGTLTNNSMQFRKMSVAGTAWFHDRDVEAKPQNRTSTVNSTTKPRKSKDFQGPEGTTEQVHSDSSKVFPQGNSETAGGRNRSITSHRKPSFRSGDVHQTMTTDILMDYLRQRPSTPFARKVKNFLLSIALCHTCFPETSSDGHINYQAASPDELALVRAAQDLGYMVIDRQNGVITIKLQESGAGREPILEDYRVLDIIEFSSARKRMSVIVRMPDQRICLLCKGADSTMMQLLRLSSLANAKALEIDRRASKRHSLEAQEAIRRASEAQSRRDSLSRPSLSLSRPSIGGFGRSSFSGRRLHPIRDELDHWLGTRDTDHDLTHRDSDSAYYTPRTSAPVSPRAIESQQGLEGQPWLQRQNSRDVFDENMAADDSLIFEHCFQHINDFATEGLRTLLYCHRFLDEEDYRGWKKVYQDATTSLTDRQANVEKAGAIIEQNMELSGATAIEDKLQDGVPEAIEKLRRAGIKLWMLTGDKRETAINIGHSCRLIKDYSTITVLDHELGDVSQRMAAATVDINNGGIAHSAVIIDGQTLTQITAHETLRKLFLSLAILVDTVVCCRASPSQKASLVHSIRRKVKNAVTLAIGDGANDIAMIQEAHVGIGITGKEGLQAARTSDYSIAQFRFLTRLLFVHGRWNYIRTCKYTLGTFWKEMLFYLTQALFQRYAGYTGTSLYESWSLSMFNTLFTSLPVIFMGVFEQDLSANTLMAVPELYQSLGPRNAGFNIPLYLFWVFMASSNAVIVFFIMLGLYGQSLFTLDNGLFAMGVLSYSGCVLVINAKIQFWELHNKTVTCGIAMFLSVGGWFLWNIVLSSIYHDNVIYNVEDGFLYRFGRNGLWWLTLILIVSACWAMEIAVKAIQCTWLPNDADLFRELEKHEEFRRRFAQAAGTLDSLHDAAPEPKPPQGSRSVSEEQRRDTEMQDILSRPRHPRSSSGAEIEDVQPSGIRRRATLETEQSPQDPKVSFAVTERGAEHTHNGDDANGKQKSRRKSTEVSDLLKKGFGSVRKSLDFV